MTQHQARVLLLDDDPHSQMFLAEILEETFPGLMFESRTVPDPSGEHDIYFIDNDFDGRPYAAELARQIRQEREDSLVIAFSGTLDRDILMELVNAGCDGVCDKSDPRDLPNVIRVLRAFLEELDTSKKSKNGDGIMGAIRSISSLLSEWNNRLDRQEGDLEKYSDKK